MLSYDEKAIKRIVLQLMNLDKTIRIYACAEQDICSLIAYLRYESTILFHLGDVNYTFYPNRREAVLHPCYLYTKKEYDKMVTQLASIVEKIRHQICVSSTLFERELRIHDALCSRVLYLDEGEQSHSIVGPLLHHRGVCDGISKTAKVLLQECGITSHVISGTTASPTGQHEAHAWNMVSINGKWYHLDITFDNTLSQKNIRYDYFNLSTSEIMKDHDLDKTSQFASIRCENDDDYYMLSGLYFESLTNLKEYLCRCIKQKVTYVHFRVPINIDKAEVIRSFHQSLHNTKGSIAYEESINDIRNIYTWRISY